MEKIDSVFWILKFFTQNWKFGVCSWSVLLYLHKNCITRFCHENVFFFLKRLLRHHGAGHNFFFLWIFSKILLVKTLFFVYKNIYSFFFGDLVLKQEYIMIWEIDFNKKKVRKLFLDYFYVILCKNIKIINLKELNKIFRKKIKK
jgi:hypothetical protein